MSLTCHLSEQEDQRDWIWHRSRQKLHHVYPKQPWHALKEDHRRLLDTYCHRKVLSSWWMLKQNLIIKKTIIINTLLNGQTKKESTRWYHGQMGMLATWLTNRMDKALHPYQCTCLSHIVKVRLVLPYCRCHRCPMIWKMSYCQERFAQGQQA